MYIPYIYIYLHLQAAIQVDLAILKRQQFHVDGAVHMLNLLEGRMRSAVGKHEAVDAKLKNVRFVRVCV